MAIWFLTSHLSMYNFAARQGGIVTSCLKFSFMPSRVPYACRRLAEGRNSDLEVRVRHADARMKQGRSAHLDANDLARELERQIHCFLRDGSFNFATRQGGIAVFEV